MNARIVAVPVVVPSVACTSTGHAPATPTAGGDAVRSPVDVFSATHDGGVPTNAHEVGEPLTTLGVNDAVPPAGELNEPLANTTLGMAQSILLSLPALPMAVSLGRGLLRLRQGVVPRLALRVQLLHQAADLALELREPQPLYPYVREPVAVVEQEELRRLDVLRPEGSLGERTPW
jgi:hypothetical protein